MAENISNYQHIIVILQLINRIKMGLAKTEMFTDKQNEISLFAKVFGHPARVAILEHLFKIKSCVCGDLVNEIGLAQPTISQHLKELKYLGLIKGNVEGTSVCYCINTENWVKMKEVMLQFLDQDIPKPDCC
jgi:DNA-binding transcriptional ArsR family regulator|tara:strand:+ start:3178 stop:3573 length:396 start_codon:yes stop_codon:yes gene_type:complete